MVDMTVKACEQVAPLLSAYSDGELQPEQAETVGEHLVLCRNCTAQLTEFAGLGNELRAFYESPPLLGFTQAVSERLRQVSIPRHRRLLYLIDRFNERWAGGLAATATALALGAWAVILMMPAARQYLAAYGGARTLINQTLSTAHTGVELAAQPKAAPPPAVQVAADEGPDSQEPSGPAIISRIEAKEPSVAVWSEPDTKTTVIWLPDDEGSND